MLIDASKWKAFYEEMTKDIQFYGHYDHGFADALDAVNEWMSMQPSVELED